MDIVEWAETFQKLALLDFATDTTKEDEPTISAIRVILPDGSTEWFYKREKENK